MVLILVIAAVVSVAAVGVMAMIGHLQNQASAYRARGSLRDRAAKLNSIFAAGQSCRLNLAGRTLPALGQTADLGNMTFYFANAAESNLSANVIMQVQGDDPELNIAAAKLSNERSLPSDPNLYVARLMIYSSGVGANVGPALVRSMPLVVKTDNAFKIVDCSVNEAVNFSCSAQTVSQSEVPNYVGGAVALPAAILTQAVLLSSEPFCECKCRISGWSCGCDW